MFVNNYLGWKKLVPSIFPRANNALQCTGDKIAI